MRRRLARIVGMRLRITTAVSAFTVLISFATVSHAQACSCVQPDAEFVRRSEGAVIARLVEVTPVAGVPGRADYDYRIQRVFKAKRRIEVGQLLSVRSWLGEAGCGLPQNLDRRYGLFLGRRAQRWTSNLCLVVGPAEMKRLISHRGSGSSAGWGCG